MTDTPSMIITGLFHDIARQCSIVSLVWSNDPEKRLGWMCPKRFRAKWAPVRVKKTRQINRCSLDDLPAAAEKAVRDLAALTGKMAVVMPG